MDAKTLNRREFFAVLPAPAAVLAAPRYEPKTAVAVYVWTQIFGAQKKPLAEGLDELFTTTRRVGYKRVELLSAFFRAEADAKTRALVKKLGLEVFSVYHGGPMHEAAAAERTVSEVLEIAASVKRLGTRMVNLNPNPKPKREPKTDAELDNQARYVNLLASRLSGLGMRLVLHHHDPEMANGAREWRHLLRNTDAKRVGLCIDFDWIIQGGQEPYALLREAGSRVATYHLRNVRGKTWTQSLGEGDYDYPGLGKFLRQTGFTGYLIVELAHRKETEITRPLGENLRLSREYVEKVFGAR